MIFANQLTVRFLDFVLSCRFVNSKNFVIVYVSHTVCFLFENEAKNVPDSPFVNRLLTILKGIYLFVGFAGGKVPLSL